MTIAASGPPAAPLPLVRRPPRGKPRRSVVHGSQALIIIVVLAVWQWLPHVRTLSANIGLLNRAFISSRSASRNSPPLSAL